MTQKDIDSYYLDIAKVVAQRSTCLFGNVGCVIVDKEDNVISTGFLADKNDILNCRKDGYCSFSEREEVTNCLGIPEHCDYMFPEVNAILTADRLRLQGSTIYMWAEDIKTGKNVQIQLDKTLSKIILSSGIKRIVMPKT